MKTVYRSLWSQVVACLFSCVMLLSLWACEKQDTLVDPSTPVSEEPVTSSARAAAATYTTSPAKDVYTGCSTGNLSCGGTVSGGLRSKVVAQTGDYFKIRIERCTIGQPFGALGDALIRAVSVCGTQAGKAPIISSGYYYIDVEFWATFSTGTVNFWPVIEFKNGSKLFGNPISITAQQAIVSPCCRPYGTLYGAINGINIYSNGSPSYASNDYNTVNGYNTGMKWQCVEFVNRYYWQKLGRKIRIAGTDAKDYFSTARSRGMVAYANNGSMAPAIGDILCIGGNTYGHVALVTGVGANYVEVAQQNVGGLAHIGFRYSRSGNSVSASALGGGYTVQGWIRP